MPKILIDLEKIKHNTKEIVKLAKKSNLNIAGVTKAVCGDLKIAKAMVDGGAKYIADSRLLNLKKLKKTLKNMPLILLRSPTLSEINQTIKYADISLQSEMEIIEKISKISLKHKKKHKIILMIEMGDRREGILEKDIYNFMSKIIKFKGIQIYGIGMNLSCYGGVIPTKEKVLKLSKISNDLEKEYKIKLKIISSGNSSSINLLTPPFKTKANNLRIGEAILLGNETSYRNSIKHCYSDSFLIEAEILELKEKPSMPDGKIGLDAFGKKTKIKNKGTILKALVSLGKQDVEIDDLIPLDKNLEILGSSSDHILLFIKNKNYTLKSKIQFIPKYGALLRAFTSKYVQKVYL